VTDVATIAGELRARLGARLYGGPRAVIVLGSGLGGLAGALDDPARVPYADLPGHPRANVAGHRGEYVAGWLEGVPVLLQSGRFHLYEGHDPPSVLLPVRVFAALGADTLILTNAAGCLRRRFRPPALMLVDDHLNLTFRSPLRGPVAEGETRFADLSSPYDEELRERARRVATANRIPLFEGTYAAVLGPSYETPAEVRMLDRLGADAVGMSTVPEALAAAARGLRVLAISVLTNPAAGISERELSHGEVLEAGERVRGSLETIVRGVLRGLPPEARGR